MYPETQNLKKGVIIMMDDFTILSKVMWLYTYSDKYFFNNFPKVHNELRQRFIKTVWALI